MNYSFVNGICFHCVYHVAFCPKYRRSVLVDGVDARLKDIVAEVCDDFNVECINVDIRPNAVFLFLSVDPKNGIHKIVKAIKNRSSHVLRMEFPWINSKIPCLWTNAYFVSTSASVPQADFDAYFEQQKGK